VKVSSKISANSGKQVSSAPSFVQRVQRLMEAIESAILKLKDEQHATYTKLVAQEKLATREVR
jgi:hypothetical protein